MTETPPPSSWRNHLRRSLPALVFLLAFFVRVPGLGWGLPNDLHDHSYHPDEPIIWLYSQNIEPTKFKFTPGFYNYGTLYLTALRISTDVAQTYAGVAQPKNVEEYWKLMALGHKAGRWLNVMFGAFACLFTFLFLRRFTGNVGALVGSGALALAPAFVVHSRFQTVDVLAVALLAAAFWAIGELSDPRRDGPKWPLLAGALVGLSAGTKYTGVLAVLAVLAALWVWRRGTFAKLAGSACAATLVGFVVATPGALLDFSKFRKDFLYEITHTSTGHGLVFEGLPNGFTVQLSNLLVGLTPPLLAMGLAGIVWAAVRRQAWMALGLAFAVPYFVLIGRAEVLFLRYTFPLYLVIVAGLAFVVQRSHIKGGIWRGWVVLALAFVGLSAQVALRMTSWMAGSDPRDDAAKFLKAESTPTTVVGFVSDPWFYSPPLFPGSAAPRSVPYAERAAQMAAAANPRVLRFTPDNPNDRFDWDLRLLDQRPDFVVFSSFEVQDLVRLRGSAGAKPEVQLATQRFEAFDQRLRLEYRLINVGADHKDPYAGSSALPHDLEYIRPLIYLWKRNDLP